MGDMQQPTSKLATMFARRRVPERGKMRRRTASMAVGWRRAATTRRVGGLPPDRQPLRSKTFRGKAYMANQHSNQQLAGRTTVLWQEIGAIWTAEWPHSTKSLWQMTPVLGLLLHA